MISLILKTIAGFLAFMLFLFGLALIPNLVAIYLADALETPFGTALLVVVSIICGAGVLAAAKLYLRGAPQ